MAKRMNREMVPLVDRQPNRANVFATRPPVSHPQETWHGGSYCYSRLDVTVWSHVSQHYLAKSRHSSRSLGSQVVVRETCCVNPNHDEQITLKTPRAFDVSCRAGWSARCCRVDASANSRGELACLKSRLNDSSWNGGAFESVCGWGCVGEFTMDKNERCIEFFLGNFIRSLVKIMSRVLFRVMCSRMVVWKNILPLWLFSREYIIF